MGGRLDLVDYGWVKCRDFSWLCRVATCCRPRVGLGALVEFATRHRGAMITGHLRQYLAVFIFCRRRWNRIFICANFLLNAVLVRPPYCSTPLLRLPGGRTLAVNLVEQNGIIVTRLADRTRDC